MIVDAVSENSDRLEAMLFLQKGFGTERAESVYNVSGKRVAEVIGANPYRLINEVDGIGVRTADSLAASLGFARNSHERIAAGVCHTLQTRMKRGDAAVPVPELM